MAPRSCSWSKRFLGRLWAAEHFIDHKWWENAAAPELLGFDIHRPSRTTRRRTLTSPRIAELDLGWSSISLDTAADPYIVHFSGMSHEDRLREMRSAADRVVGVCRSDQPLVRAVSPDDARPIGVRGLDLLERGS